jgi:hypothetical protein
MESCAKSKTSAQLDEEESQAATCRNEKQGQRSDSRTEEERQAGAKVGEKKNKT